MRSDEQKDCLIPDISDLSAEQTANLEKWANMYDRTYPRVGYVAANELRVSAEVLATAKAKEEEMRRMLNGQ